MTTTDAPPDTNQGIPKHAPPIADADIGTVTSNRTSHGTSGGTSRRTCTDLASPLVVPPREQFRAPSVERAPIVGQRKGTSSTFTDRQIGSVVGAARIPLLARLQDSEKLRRTVAQHTRIQVRVRGRVKTIELDGLASADVRKIQEVRRPAAWARRGSPSGLFIQRADLLDDDLDDAGTSGDASYQVWHESALENSHLIVLSADGRFGAFTTQALDLQWTYEGMELQHIPDLVVELKSVRTLIVDCRHADNRDDDVFATQVALTAALCRELGWQYELWDQLPKDLNCNLRDLENFVIVASPVAQVARDVAASCQQTFRTAAGFQARAQEHVDGGDATGALKHALWRGLVDVDLTRPIRGYSELVPGVSGGRGLILDGDWREVVVA